MVATWSPFKCSLVEFAGAEITNWNPIVRRQFHCLRTPLLAALWRQSRSRFASLVVSAGPRASRINIREASGRRSILCRRMCQAAVVMPQCICPIFRQTSLQLRSQLKALVRPRCPSMAGCSVDPSEIRFVVLHYVLLPCLSPESSAVAKRVREHGR